jgi:hypothetical protein
MSGMFLDPDVKASLRLVETRVFGSGVVLLRYQRPRALAPATC